MNAYTSAMVAKSGNGRGFPWHLAPSLALSTAPSRSRSRWHSYDVCDTNAHKLLSSYPSGKCGDVAPRLGEAA